ncbi:MAG: hypothetical protein KI790_15475 [Cyclobacteriaceae bacterium]|nr:hypothetical protein [Cyclobacteriaceae bacterium HetDA_MAG_MS6]
MNWHEELPNNCPPSDSESPEGRTFYRLCSNNPAQSEDFISQKEEKPNRTFAGISTCTLRAVSIWNDREKCLNLKKLKTQRNKSIGEFILNNEDGLIKQTFKAGHYSWWRSDQFNPNIVIITEN